MMDIYEYLEMDHKKVSQLFKQFKKAPSKRKLDIARFIADELLVHAKSEQETLYKFLEEHSENKGEALHGWKEHEEIEKLIKTFDHQTLPENTLIIQVEKLEKLVRHHVIEEEGVLFRRARKVLSAEQSYAIKELMHDLKHQLLIKRLKEVF
ncbi:MAG: hemerythrin domain-containing protein [Legionella sp.]|nr:hemerythrin domain-containing protein [Legionella sp.]